MSDYLVFDIETTYGKSYGRAGNRWDEEFGLCAIGWKFGKGVYDDVYTVTERKLATNEIKRVPMRPGVGLPFPDLSDCTLLVGHNIKYDLIYYWDHPIIQAFLKRGGKIWDTMHAEYLLSGQLYNFHSQNAYGISLKQTAIRRKCKHSKLDIVAAMWNEGIRTEDIPKEVLLEYQQEDVYTTEEIFLQQIDQAREQGQVRMIQRSMDAILTTTEMEFNGSRIDVALAMEQKKELDTKLIELNRILNGYIPELPTQCSFNWNSGQHLSALLFGGVIKYTDKEQVLDQDGKPVYYLKQERQFILDENNNKIKFKGGKRKGEYKTKLVTVPDIERGCKTRNAVFSVTLEGVTIPNPEWETATEGYYSTAASILEELGKRNIHLVTHLLERRSIEKDLGTYYIREVNGKCTGLLTNVQPVDNCVHGNYNHSTTKTRRLSSSNPNLQNLSKKSEIKSTFISRWDTGYVSEIDYSQLEVVTKAALAHDIVMLQALLDGIDFHCDWLSLAENIDYQFIYDKVHKENDPVWKKKRSDIKPVTFGEAYGAGAASLSVSSGLPADVIENAMQARKLKYPKLYEFDDEVMLEASRTRQLTTMRTKSGYQRAVGFWRSPTTTLYHFLEDDSHAWQQHSGTMTTLQSTQIKNYPSQGTAGEIMETMMGFVYRQLIKHNLTDDIKLTLNVHDALYADYRTKEIALKYIPKIAAVLEDVCFVFGVLYKDVDWDTPFPTEATYGKNIKNPIGEITERDLEWVHEIRAELINTYT